MAAIGNFAEFDIIEIARRCNIIILKKLNDGQWLARCPFCGDSIKSPNRGHLYLKPSTGDYACHRCGKMGKTLGLYAGLRNIDTKSAYKELLDSEVRPLRKPEYSNAPVIEEPAPLQRRNEVYSAMLDMLQLKTLHRADLLKRGLNNEYIVRNNYKSYPEGKKERAAVCERLSRNHSLFRVPGFYVNDDDEWDIVAYPSGYLLPVRNYCNQIQGFQLRVLPYDAAKGSKYLWLSSAGKPGGAKSPQCFHLAIPPGVKMANRLWLTEGILKADIASFFTNVPFMAVAGVNATRGITDVLSSLKINEVVMAYDMDQDVNPLVKQALYVLEGSLGSANIQTLKATWPMSERDGEPYPKGIDDACLERRKQSLEVTEASFVTLSKTVTKKVVMEGTRVTVEETVKYEVKGPSSAGLFEKARGLFKKII